MVDIWKYAKNLPNVKIKATDGEVFEGKIIAVFDAEESGEEMDNLSLELANGQIISFYAEEIAAVEEKK